MATPIFSDKQILGLKKAIKEAKVQKTASIIDAVGVASAMIVSTIFSVANEKQRQDMAENLSKLDERGIEELNAYLSRQQTNTDRIRAYFDFFSRYRGELEGKRISSQIEAIASQKSDSEKRLMKIVFGGALVLILVAVVIKKITK